VAKLEMGFQNQDYFSSVVIKKREGFKKGERFKEVIKIESL
jgi:hypothetical protein